MDRHQASPKALIVHLIHRSKQQQSYTVYVTVWVHFIGFLAPMLAAQAHSSFKHSCVRIGCPNTFMGKERCLSTLKTAPSTGVSVGMSTHYTLWIYTARVQNIIEERWWPTPEMVNTTYVFAIKHANLEIFQDTSLMQMQKKSVQPDQERKLIAQYKYICPFIFPLWLCLCLHEQKHAV